MAKTNNITKRPPKGSIRFSITLSEEQKVAKEQILKHPFSFIHGNAGSGKTLLAVQTALDQYFKRNYNKIIITRPTVSTEDNGFLPGSEKELSFPGGYVCSVTVLVIFGSFGPSFMTSEKEYVFSLIWVIFLSNR